VGTILRVLPRITEDGTILLDVSAEDSSYKDKLVQANDQQNSVPEKTQSKAETQVRVIDGQTVVLGGLKRSENTDKKSSTPFLGDIPGIGLLFRNPSHKFQKSNLMIFITTSIVDETTRSETEKLLAESDNIMGKQFRKAKKSNWGRLVDTLTANQREIGVSIGQSGQMYSNGKKVTLDELRDLFKTMAAPETRTLVIRRHETAPKKIVEDVETAAREVGLRVEYDDSLEVMTAAPASASAPADAANPLENPLAPAPATASAPVDVVQTDAQVKRDAEKASEPAKQ
jgi:biopolymer transport protein ExbD